MGDLKDEDMNAPQSIHTGAVLGFPHLKLIPEGGPQCSAMLTSEEPSIYLGGRIRIHPDDAIRAEVAGLKQTKSGRAEHDSFGVDFA
jgi:hypothetical protein